MDIIIFRPSVDFSTGHTFKKLEECFRDKHLLDKTVVEDMVIYVFKEQVAKAAPITGGFNPNRPDKGVIGDY